MQCLLASIERSSFHEVCFQGVWRCRRQRVITIKTRQAVTASRPVRYFCPCAFMASSIFREPDVHQWNLEASILQVSSAFTVTFIQGEILHFSSRIHGDSSEIRHMIFGGNPTGSQINYNLSP
jgi:hypothetical protein